MPKLFEIDVCSNWGSTGKIAEQIGLKAIDAGWDVLTAYGRNANDSALPRIKVGNRLSVYEHYFENILLDREGLASRNPTKRLVEKIKDFGPDVVQLHDIHNHWLNYKLLFEYLNSTNIKVVWTFHDCWAFTGHCYHFVNANCERYQTMCHECPQKNKFGLDRSALNYATKKDLFTINNNLLVVTVSEWLKNVAEKSFFKGNSIQRIYNGVDINIFRPRKSDFRERLGLIGKFVLLASGTVWQQYKGIDDYRKLREELSDEYAIVFVGVTDRYRDVIPSGIVSVDKTDSAEELAEYYSMADCVISLSKLETFGLTIAEGMACGTPAIVYDHDTALPELITSETGLIVEHGNIKALCKAVETLRNNGKETYSAACRKRAEECFDKDKCFLKYIDLYESLI